MPDSLFGPPAPTFSSARPDLLGLGPSLAPPPAPPTIATPAAPAAAEDRPATWDDVVTHYAKQYQIDPRLALAVARTESLRNGALDPTAVSSAGARGIMQLMPATAARLGVNIDDPHDNVRGGMMELRRLLNENNNDVTLALRRYNGSPTAPDSATEPYVQKVFSQLKPGGAQRPGAQPSSSMAGYQTVPPPNVPQGPPPKGFDEQHPWLATVADMITDRPIPEGTGPAEELLRRGGAGVAKFAQEATTSLNPVNIAKGIGAVLTTDPRTTLRNLYEAHKRVWEEGQKMRDAGEEFGGQLRQAEATIPLLGPRIAEADKFAREGEYSRAAGAAVDLAGQVIGPGKLKGGGSILPRAFTPTLTAAEEAAVKLGLAEKTLPIDVATASGSHFAKNIQAVAEATPIGSAVQGLVRGQRQIALPALAEKLADRVHPSSITPAQAGARITSAVERTISNEHQYANMNYGELRNLEANPRFARPVPVRTENFWLPDGTLGTRPVMEVMPLPADLRAVKPQLTALRDRYTQTMPIARQQASPGLVALNQIIDGPDFVPASVLDRNLGAIKEITRGAEMPELRDASQGLASQAIKALEDAQDAALAPAGPRAAQLLQKGRAATSAKYAAKEILDTLADEPVRTFRGTTQAGDAAFQHLREVVQLDHTGKLAPEIGRAVLEDLFEHASGLEEGWSRAEGVARKWEQLGNQTKDLLYGNKRADLDKFFLLQKMLSRQANPSRTMLVGASATSALGVWANPFWGMMSVVGAGGLAGLMNSRTGIKLLTEGLQLPAGGAKAAAWTAAVMNRLHKDGQLDQVGAPPPRPGALPDGEDASSPPPPPPPR